MMITTTISSIIVKPRRERSIGFSRDWRLNNIDTAPRQCGC
jgi:hypothetical protein